MMMLLIAGVIRFAAVTGVINPRAGRRSALWSRSAAVAPQRRRWRTGLRRAGGGRPNCRRHEAALARAESWRRLAYARSCPSSTAIKYAITGDLGDIFWHRTLGACRMT